MIRDLKCYFSILPKKWSFQIESNQTTTLKNSQDLEKQYDSIQSLHFNHSNPKTLKKYKETQKYKLLLREKRINRDWLCDDPHVGFSEQEFQNSFYS